jgi:hypothetical protein
MINNKPNNSFVAIITIALTLSLSSSMMARPRASSIQQTAAKAEQPDIHTLDSIGLQFELPKGWKAETQENGNVFLTFEEGAGNVTFVFDENYTEVVEGMKSGLKDKLKDLKFDGAAKENTHNGMKHISESGSGMMEGVKINWSIDVLKATKHVTLLTFGLEEVLQKHMDEYVKFVSSLKRSN